MRLSCRRSVRRLKMARRWHEDNEDRGRSACAMFVAVAGIGGPISMPKGNQRFRPSAPSATPVRPEIRAEHGDAARRKTEESVASRSLVPVASGHHVDNVGGGAPYHRLLTELVIIVCPDREVQTEEPFNIAAGFDLYSPNRSIQESSQSTSPATAKDLSLSGRDRLSSVLS